MLHFLELLSLNVHLQLRSSAGSQLAGTAGFLAGVGAG